MSYTQPDTVLDDSNPPFYRWYTGGTLNTSGRFLIYGGSGAVRYWRNWFSIQPQFSDWHRERLGAFGDVVVELFEKPHRRPARAPRPSV